MPIGERARHGSRPGTGSPGYTYLLLLFWLALAGAGLAAAGSAWSTAAQRSREAELIFRGEQYAAALASYRRATPRGQPDAPSSLHELLEDRRGRDALRHLRRVYADPFTGRADWELLREQGRIRAVRSRSQQPVFQVPPQPGTAAQPVAADWVFGGGAAAPVPPPAASAPTRSSSRNVAVAAAPP